MEDDDDLVDSQLWHACAGGMVQIPALNSMVYYFPQGHAEHTLLHHFTPPPPPIPIPPLILSKVSAVKFLADPHTDEVYAQITLIPSDDHHQYSDSSSSPPPPPPHKLSSFAKTLTQSDANNGGGFSVPRYCADTIFPPLDYSADPPVQTVLAKDLHGHIWKFRHIYRGTPRRHLLTTGWSIFVNHKKLIAGDSIVFLRTQDGDLCVGIRRAKIPLPAAASTHSQWTNPSPSYATTPPFKPNLRVTPESVIHASTLAANAHPFQVLYYPRATTPEFCVKASSVRDSMRINWSPGMRFKMAFETEDSSRISWFMGTISNAQVADPVRWPNSPWRLLQVTWDEPDLLQNVKRVSPWLVELVSSIPTSHMSPFSPPRKKLRPPHQSDVPLDGLLPIPSFSTNTPGSSSPLCCLSDNTPAGIQGARHTQFGVSISDLHPNKLQSGLFPTCSQRLDNTVPPSRIPSGLMMANPKNTDSISCLLSIGNSNQTSKKSEEGNTPQFLLFGQPILTEQQISLRFSAGSVSPVLSPDGIPDMTTKISDSSEFAPHHSCGQGNPSRQVFPWHKDHWTTELDLETGHCKVFMESEDVGRTLNLSLLGSYEELHGKLASLFDFERSDMIIHVLYQDATGVVKHTGDEPFSEFIKTVKRLTVVTDSGNEKGRASITALQDAEKGYSSSSDKRSLLRMFA